MWRELFTRAASAESVSKQLAPGWLFSFTHI
jgi:hypothetical protein